MDGGGGDFGGSGGVLGLRELHKQHLDIDNPKHHAQHHKARRAAHTPERQREKLRAKRVEYVKAKPRQQVTRHRKQRHNKRFSQHIDLCVDAFFYQPNVQHA